MFATSLAVRLSCCCDLHCKLSNLATKVAMFETSLKIHWKVRTFQPKSHGESCDLLSFGYAYRKSRDSIPRKQ